MRATKFEFEQRFWLFGLIIFIGFALSSVDDVNFAACLLHLLAPLIDPGSSRGIFLLRLIFGGGALLIFLAALLRTWATAYLRAEVVHDANQHSEALVADGPFRYVRNPLYFANVPMLAGLGVMASRLGWIFIVVATWIFVYRLILREEDGLILNQGEKYRAYMNAVPRFLPALTPRIPSGGGQPRWGQAIAGEMIFWLFGVGVLCFALTLNIKPAGIVTICGFAVYFVAVPLLRKRASGSKLEN